MPSLLRKLSSRRSRTRSTNNTKKELSVQTNSVDKKKIAGGDVPLKSISIQPGEDVVSPLKMKSSSNKTLNKRMSSSGFTDGTSSTLSTRDSWSEHDTAVITPSSTTSSNNAELIIPPRPSQSHWNEEDFLRVITVWELSQEEIYMMRQLEAKLYDVTHWKNNPFEVVRFMKGPQGYKPAEKLFRKMIQWRLANNVDTILEDYTPPPVLMDYCPSAILEGLDKDGDPIYLERAGATDAAGLLKHFGHDALIKHTIWLRELSGRGAWIQSHEARMGRPITQVTIVYDLAGLNARHLRPGVLPLFAHMMRMTQDNYTGPVKRMVIINCPSIFRYVWAIAKNFFDPWAVAKMTFTGPHDAEEKLSQFMDLEVLPPCVSPSKGCGKAAEGMPQRFEGGIPPSMEYQKPISEVVKPKILPPPVLLFNDNNDSSESVSAVSASVLGSGFFQTNEQGDVLSSSFFRCDEDGGDDDSNNSDPLA